MAAPLDEQIATDCRHHLRVRLETDKVCPLLMCLLCGCQFNSGNGRRVPLAPANWERMGLEGLRVWYAQTVLDAMI